VPRLPVAFVPRRAPLAPLAAAAQGPAARALAERLLARDDDALAALSGVASPDGIIVLGPAEALPWVDGVVYLGRDPEAPALLLPTALAPDAPPALLERAVLTRVAAAPVAVLADPPALASLAAARPLDRARLRAWLGEAPP
jgi:hypothetical protein